MARRWEGPVAYEGQETGDDRVFAKDALKWELPVPLLWCPALSGGHDNQLQVGVIQTLVRKEDGAIWGTGVFLDTEDGLRAQAECAAAEAAGMAYGISVDLDDVSLELRVREEIVAEQEEMLAALFGDEEASSDKKAEKADEEGRVKVAEMHSGDYMTVFTSARVRGATLVSLPAFKDAQIRLLEEIPGGDTASVTEQREAAAQAAGSLVAGAYPVAPPAEWFENPGFTAKTPLVVTDDGRIYGHGATWDTFHIGFAGQKVPPPRSATNNAYFHTGYLRTAEGTDIPIGRITMTAGHAPDGLSEMDARAHYDNTAAVVADVVSGEDEFGIWVSGALRPNVTDEQVRELRAAPLSGDWREVDGNLELVAFLAVNTAGFPIPRMAALVASGSVRTLVRPRKRPR
jgi:hypothetical protein